ncbi:hypothetical protein PGB90_009551 [Kerria lacca]
MERLCSQKKNNCGKAKVHRQLLQKIIFRVSCVWISILIITLHVFILLSYNKISFKLNCSVCTSFINLLPLFRPTASKN